MPFCPVCKKEYPASVASCPDDKAALVDELPFQTVRANDGTTWVEIASTKNSDEAELICGFLNGEGIAAEIEHAEASILPTTFGRLGDLRVYVAADDEQRALELLKQRNAAYDNLDDDEETLVTDEGVADIDENAPPEAE